MSNQTQQATSTYAASSEVDLLDEIVNQSNIAKSEEEKNRAKSQITELANEVMQGTVTISDNLAASIDSRIAQIDALISKQLSTIMHAPEFQKLESTQIQE